MKATSDQQHVGDSAGISSAIAQSLNKFNQGVKDDNKFQRKNALETMKKQLAESFKTTTTDSSLKYPSETVKHILRSSLNALNDQVEKCRECACDLVKLILEQADVGNATKSNKLIKYAFKQKTNLH